MEKNFHKDDLLFGLSKISSDQNIEAKNFYYGILITTIKRTLAKREACLQKK